jgi:hypothetical protein
MIYAQHDILQHMGIDLSILRHRFLNFRQFHLLLVVGDGHAAHPLRFPTLPYCSAVNATTEHQHTIKFPLLSRRRFEFILVGFANTLLFHMRLFCLIGAHPTRWILSWP